MQEYTCLKCHKTFERWKHQKPTYCSQACHFASHKRIAKCPVCGKERELDKAKPQKDFCSLKCWGLSNRVVRERKCQTCSIVFRPVTRTKKGKYCSKSCANKGRTLPIEEKWRRWKLRVKEYRKLHPDKCAQWKQKRRALEIGAKGHFTDREWSEIKERFNQRCAHCKQEKKLTVDHIIPLSKGGTNYIENIQPLCISCNSRKSVKI